MYAVFSEKMKMEPIVSVVLTKILVLIVMETDQIVTNVNQLIWMELSTQNIQDYTQRNSNLTKTNQNVMKKDYAVW